MKQQDKKDWTEPLLTVLTRTNPEEQVLCGCKWEDRGQYKGTFHDGPGKIGNCYIYGKYECKEYAHS